MTAKGNCCLAMNNKQQKLVSAMIMQKLNSEVILRSGKKAEKVQTAEVFLI